MMEFTTVGGQRIMIKPSSINHFREMDLINSSSRDKRLCTRICFSNDCVDLDISFEDFKSRLEENEHRNYYNMESIRKL